MRRKLWALVGAAMIVSLLAAAPATAQDAAIDRDLLSYVPFGHRYGCRVLDVRDPSRNAPAITAEQPSIQGAYACGPQGPAATLHYYRFSSLEAMNRAYLSIAQSVGENSGAEGSCPSNRTWGFDDDTDGRVACFFSTQGLDGQSIAESVVRVWTDDDSLILGYAAGAIGDRDAVAMRTWWHDEAGPRDDPDTEGLPTVERHRDDEAALLQSIPKRTREHCEVVDRYDPREVEPVQYSLASFLSATVVCSSPDPGVVNHLSYSSVDPAVIEDLAEQALTPNDEDLDAADEDDRCPATGGWDVKEGKKKRVVGTYTCYYVEDPDAGRVAIWIWTDTDQGILGGASNADGDAEALHDWWLSAASGPIQPSS